VSDEVVAPARVNMRRLKKFVSQNLFGHSALRDVVLDEEDDMATDEFLHKLDVWLALLRRKEDHSHPLAGVDPSEG
jgi:hypothetical protein